MERGSELVAILAASFQPPYLEALASALAKKQAQEQVDPSPALQPYCGERGWMSPFPTKPTRAAWLSLHSWAVLDCAASLLKTVLLPILRDMGIFPA